MNLSEHKQTSIPAKFLTSCCDFDCDNFLLLTFCWLKFICHLREFTNKLIFIKCNQKQERLLRVWIRSLKASTQVFESECGVCFNLKLSLSKLIIVGQKFAISLSSTSGCSKNCQNLKVYQKFARNLLSLELKLFVGHFHLKITLIGFMVLCVPSSTICRSRKLEKILQSNQVRNLAFVQWILDLICCEICKVYGWPALLLRKRSEILNCGWSHLKTQNGRSRCCL